jgi:hypothetical protein
VHDDAARSPSGTARNRDLDEAAESSDLPQGGSAAMAQRGIRPARENSRHPAALPGELWPTDRVDTAHDGMEPASRKPMNDGILGVSEGDELLPTNNAMLAANQRP